MMLLTLLWTGADAVMLSGENSRKLSRASNQKMTQIIEAVEDSPLIQVPQNTPQIKKKRFITKTFVDTQLYGRCDSKQKAICTLTNSGWIQASKFRHGDHQHIF
jgi:pyruvate kinase